MCWVWTCHRLALFFGSKSRFLSAFISVSPPYVLYIYNERIQLGFEFLQTRVLKGWLTFVISCLNHDGGARDIMAIK